MDSGDPVLLTAIVAALERGERIFLTGGAGTGKTHLVRLVATQLASRGVNTIVTASTGLASTLLFQPLEALASKSLRGPSTLHSAARLPFSSDEDSPRLLLEGTLSLSEIQVAIIDEFSMVDQTTFDRFMLRIPPRAGILAIGDFFQLPPVRQLPNGEPEFAFHSAAFTSFRACELTRNYRQDDPAFVAFLNSLRRGQLDRQLLSSIHSNLLADFPVLFGTRREAQRENALRLDRIPEELRASDAQVLVGNSERAYKWFASHTRAERRLQYKIGMRVMNIQNHTARTRQDLCKLVNGDIGRVLAVGPSQTGSIPLWVSVKFDRIEQPVVVEPFEFIRQNLDGEVEYNILQLPLIAAYGLTVHKAQGLTLDHVNVDGAKINFSAGQVYVALSRCRTMGGLRVVNANYFSAFTRPQVEQYYANANYFIPPQSQLPKPTSPNQEQRLATEETTMIEAGTSVQNQCKKSRGFFRFIWDSFWN